MHAAHGLCEHGGAYRSFRNHSAGVYAAPEPTPSPTPEPVQVEEMADLSSAYDRNGLLIVGEEHFQQYISFKNIQVYEQCGDTFMDAVAVNEYPDTLVCALNIRFLTRMAQR